MEFDRFREAADNIVAAMHFHQHRRALTDGLDIVLQMRAIRRADLAQLRARAAHDVGNAERPADLDEFAARNDDLLPERERGQRQQHSRRIVVDHGGGLRTGQFADQVLDQIVAIAAAATVQIELEVHRLRQRNGHGTHGFVGQDRAPEVRMEHRAREVEYGPQAASPSGGERAGDVGGNAHLAKRQGALSGLHAAPPGVERGTHGRQDPRASVFGDQRRNRRRRQHALDRWHTRHQPVQVVGGRVAHTASRLTRSGPEATTADWATHADSQLRSSADRA
jgi:hypothetical protein